MLSEYEWFISTRILNGCFGKTTKNDYWLRNVCPSVRPSSYMERLGSHLTDVHEIRYLSIFFSENLSRKFRFHYSLTRMTGTLHEDRCTFMIISRSVLLVIRNVSDERCTENQSMHFMFNTLLLIIVPLMRCCGEIFTVLWQGIPVVFFSIN